MRPIRLLAPAFAALVALTTPLALADDNHADDLQLGAQVYQGLQAKNEIVTDSPYDPILQSTGRRIAAAAEPHWFTERFYVVRGNQANAFSAPGGYVFVNEGLLDGVDNVAELANVLAHETAHLVNGDVTAQNNAKKEQNIAAGLGKMFAGNNAQAQTGLNVATMGTNYGFLNYSRQQEFAADQGGVTIAAKAGFNPWGTIWYLTEVERISGDAGYESYVQHHPSTSERIEKIEQYFKDNPATFARWTNTMPPGNGLPGG
jgi:predicted Zn-dependent protease